MDEEENLIAFGVLAMSMGEALKRPEGVCSRPVGRGFKISKEEQIIRVYW